MCMHTQCDLDQALSRTLKQEKLIIKTLPFASLFPYGSQTKAEDAHPGLTTLSVFPPEHRDNHS